MDEQVGISREGLSKKRLEQILIPLPPLNEQKRIIEKVNALMKLCDELESSLTSLKQENDNLGNAVLEEVIHGPQIIAQ